MNNNSYQYTGNPINPKYSLNIGGRTLESDKDFDVEITDNINVGTASVLIKGKGKFKGEIKRTFTITPVPARSLSFFSDNTEFEYNGEPCEINVAVKFGDTILEEGKDYTVEYIDNVEPGTANAKLTFMGNFEGVMMVPFTIYAPEKNAAPADELENISEVSSLAVSLGESVKIKSGAKGGKPPYSYAVYYKKVISKNWVVLHDFSEETDSEIKPMKDTRYHVLVKAKDSRGIIAKKYFKIAVGETASLQPDADPAPSQTDDDPALPQTDNE